MNPNFYRKILSGLVITALSIGLFPIGSFAESGLTWEQFKSYGQGFIGDTDALVKFNSATNTYVGYFNKPGNIEAYTFPTSGVAYESQYSEGLKNQFAKSLDGQNLIVPASYINSADLLSKTELTNDFPELNNETSMQNLAFILTNFPYSNWKNSLRNIKSKTNEITNGATTEDEKVKRIYDWITTNVTYDEYSSKYLKGEISETTYKANANNSIYTPFGTYDNKKGVCQGISYLFYFMLEFAGIKGSDIETGYLLVKYLPHQWNRVGDYYFDLTSDLSPKNRYLHYKLPKEIINLDREQVSTQVYLTKKGSDLSTQIISNTLNYVKSTGNYDYRNTYYFQGASAFKGSFSLKNFEFAYGKVLDINQFGQFIDYSGNQNRFSSLRTYAMKDDTTMENALLSGLLTSKDVSLGVFNGRQVLIDLGSSVTESPLNKPTYEPVFENLKSNSTVYSKSETPLFSANSSTINNAPVYSNSTPVIGTNPPISLPTPTAYPYWVLVKGNKTSFIDNMSITLMKISSDSSIALYSFPYNFAVNNNSKLFGDLNADEMKSYFESSYGIKIGSVETIQFTIDTTKYSSIEQIQNIQNAYIKLAINKRLKLSNQILDKISKTKLVTIKNNVLSRTSKNASRYVRVRIGGKARYGYVYSGGEAKFNELIKKIIGQN